MLDHFYNKISYSSYLIRLSPFFFLNIQTVYWEQLDLGFKTNSRHGLVPLNMYMGL